MTKTIAFALASFLFACAADHTEDADVTAHQSNPAEVGSAPPTAPTASVEQPCPAENSGPSKTPGLLEKCEGAYLCKMSSSDSGHEMHLHSDGVACFAREAGLGDYELRPDGTIGGENRSGSWTGDSVGWEYTAIYNNNGKEWTYTCAPIASK